MTAQIQKSRNSINSIMDQISSRYNAENDIIPGAPRVTHTDFRLLEITAHLGLIFEEQQRMIEALQERTRTLQDQITALQDQENDWKRH